MEKSILFQSWHQWKVCMMSGIKKFSWGFMRIITCIILGIISIFAWLWRCACRFVGKYPNIALGGFIVIAVVVWLMTFVSMRVRAVGAEHQRDSIAWQYQDFKNRHGYGE